MLQKAGAALPNASAGALQAKLQSRWPHPKSSGLLSQDLSPSAPSPDRQTNKQPPSRQQSTYLCVLQPRVCHAVKGWCCASEGLQCWRHEVVYEEQLRLGHADCVAVAGRTNGDASRCLLLTLYIKETEQRRCIEVRPCVAWVRLHSPSQTAMFKRRLTGKAAAAAA